MAAEYFRTGHLLTITHETLFSLAAFGGLLIPSYSHGRQAARLALLAYLLLALA